MRRIHTISLILLAAVSLTAASLPSIKPEEAGLSSERLKQIHALVQRHIDAGDITGAVMFVARKGQIAYLEAQGTMDLETKTPMTRDSMFRFTIWTSSQSNSISFFAWASTTTWWTRSTRFHRSGIDATATRL